ncbi:MAG: alpha/beta hydrolase family protein [Bacteroidia bacterium]
MKTTFEHHTNKGNSIKISMYSEAPFGEQPCIIYFHGLKGFKDWGFVPYIGEFFAKKGYTFLCFNFSHNGIGEKEDEFTEMAKFHLNTHSLEVAEANEIINLCAFSNFFGAYLQAPIGVIGHSRGGGVAILAGQSNKEVNAIATWAAVNTYERYDKSTRNEWRKKGFYSLVNARTGQVFTMGLQMLEDIEKNGKGKLNILTATQNLDKPLLILHGNKDGAVPFYEAEQLNMYANAELTDYYLVPEADHTFGAVHPFAGTTPHLEDVLQKTLAFFDKRLNLPSKNV